MPKGSVNIEVFNDRLRLAWSWQGKRFWLYIGLPDSIANRKAASMKASQIELDMASGNFDPSLPELLANLWLMLPSTYCGDL
jgi:integrase